MIEFPSCRLLRSKCYETKAEFGHYVIIETHSELEKSKTRYFVKFGNINGAISQVKIRTLKGYCQWFKRPKMLELSRRNTLFNTTH
jgi:hypothetical protein